MYSGLLIIVDLDMYRRSSDTRQNTTLDVSFRHRSHAFISHEQTILFQKFKMNNNHPMSRRVLYLITLSFIYLNEREDIRGKSSIFLSGWYGGNERAIYVSAAKLLVRAAAATDCRVWLTMAGREPRTNGSRVECVEVIFIFFISLFNFPLFWTSVWRWYNIYFMREEVIFCCSVRTVKAKTRLDYGGSGQTATF